MAAGGSEGPRGSIAEATSRLSCARPPRLDIGDLAEKAKEGPRSLRSGLRPRNPLNAELNVLWRSTGPLPGEPATR